MVIHKEWDEMLDQAIRSTFGVILEKPFMAHVEFAEGTKTQVTGTLEIRDGYLLAHLLDLNREDDFISPFNILSNSGAKLVFSDQGIRSDAELSIYLTPSLGADISVPWAIPRASTGVVNTPEWPGYGEKSGKAFESAHVRIGGLPFFIKDQWIERIYRSYQKHPWQGSAYGGLILETENWRLELRESPRTRHHQTHYYVGVIRNNNGSFSISELNNFLERTELFLSVITGERKRFDLAVAIQQGDMPNSQRIRLVKAHNYYSPIPNLDPEWGQLGPWLELYHPFHMACQKQATGATFMEAVKRYVSAAEMVRYSSYGIAQTWAALEAIAKATLGKPQNRLKLGEIKTLVKTKSSIMESLEEPYAWADPEGNWVNQANMVRTAITHGAVIEYSEPEKWFTTQRLVRALIMSHLKSL